LFVAYSSLLLERTQWKMNPQARRKPEQNKERSATAASSGVGKAGAACLPDDVGQEES